ncbi:Spy0128 family protein [Collinsella intestinalis]|uniref:Spy0128 family protein n=1 Tax=Collinsella intestinalis TaxID=147207 RepID=UPI002673125E|nr:FctA domain-containing protein [Collinsella intestinalis]
MRSAVRRLAKVLPSVVLGAALALTAVVPAAKAAPVDGAPSWPEGQKTTVVDPSTITTWKGVAHEDTENIGRIWTDKTVSKTYVELPSGNEPAVKIGNSDFLVGLSALSSTSNTTTTSSRPLDIVLVLDVSGSMDDGLGGGFVYSPTYAVSESLFAPTYYAKTEDGKYQKIDRVGDSSTGLFFDHWELNGKEVLPKRSEGDSADGRIQFYQRTYETISKIEGLKSAANQFITATVEKNGEITDKARQHRISIVKFAGEMRNTIGNNISRGRNYTQVVSDLKAYTPSTVSEATDTIDSLRTGGATSADYGLLQAQDVLNGRKAGNRVDELVGAREGAQKVVIFFTDGQPTYNNGFQDTVANNAIKTAQAMKAGGARVYSVGVFADANPGDTRGAFNAYMHGVSSNYPNAEAYSDLGSRAENSNYYKAATDADELNGIFQEISDEINKGTGLPTHTTEGMANKSGYITFTDELGAYMRVDGFRSLIFADKVFDPQSKTSNGLIDTYTYEGTGGNALYPNGNVKDIVVQVQRSEELAKGDIVTVKIPASLIPLRNFKVTTTEAGSTMEIGEAYPLRIFYGVSIKPEVHAAVMSGAADQALRDYIAGNTADGKTNFYSNFYDGRVIVEDGKRLGNTTASFEPSDANSFYYFTEDTPLYTDRECKIPLTKEPTAGEEYYYKRSYYKKGSAGQAEKAESIIKFRGVNFNRPEPYWSQAADGSYFIKKGAPRLTRVDSLTLTKESNVTGTATEVINPRWDNVDNPHMVNVSLGNNGKLSVEMPGSLAINKDARIAPNKDIDPEVLDGKSFEFEISIPSAAGKTMTAEVRNAQNERVGKPFDMEFDASGKRRQGLKDEETLYIHGLDAGAEYTVTEVKDKMPAGFEQTSPEGDVAGAIVAGKTQEARFVNTYDVEPVAMEGKDLAGYRKIFDRWDLAGSFDIELRAVQAGNPMPEGSTPGTDGRGSKVVQATKAKPAGDFGSISFDKPGVFEYTVREVAPSAEGVIPGMTYSNASYTIRVDVVDDGKGGLAATSSMTRTNNDAGVDVSEPVEGKNAVFTNSFNARETSAGPEAVKVYTNNGGPETAMKDGKFTFKVKPLTDGAPIPDGVEFQPDGYIHVKNSGSSVVFGQAAYGEDQVGKTYEYEIRELIPAGADADNGYTLNGMTYDPSVYIAAFNVSVDESATVKVSVSYYKMVDGAREQLPEGRVPEFANVYDPKDVTLPGDTASPLKARKTLKGRDAVDGETFEFTLSAANNAAVAALEHDEIVFGGDSAATELKASVVGLKNGVPADAPFGPVTFTKPGTYEFNVTENAPEDGAGMTYDRSVQKVRVVVADDNGALTAKVSYTGAATDAAAFTNTYRSSLAYGDAFSLDVTKTLTGRAQKAGEFGFTIVGADKDATDRLAESDKSFTTIAPAAKDVPTKMPGKLAGLRFTQADAGKTFSYTLSEVVPDKKLGGVTYDPTTYRIDIEVVDNADGTMKTITTVSKNGGEPVGTYDSSDGPAVVTLGFKNAYKAAPVEVIPDPDSLGLYKVLKGRDWLDTDTFHFTMKSAVPGQPESAVAEKDVAAPGAQEGDKVPFSFGSYTFDTPGTYYYAVDETPGNIPGISYDDHSARVVVSVTDNLEGKLVADIKVFEGVFTNTYKAELDHNAAGGLIIAKTTYGHDMAEGQFAFQVQTLDGEGTTADDTAKRIGISQGTAATFGNVAGKDGERVEMKSPAPIKFTQADDGKLFKFKVSEMGADGKPGTAGKKDGYTYSDAVYTIELLVADNLDGTLALTTKVTDKDNKKTTVDGTAANPLATTIDFVNTYAAETTADSDIDLTTAATKTLDGRHLKADEFSFEIVSNPIDEQGIEQKIAEGKNAAAEDGEPAAVTFEPASIGYSLEQLKNLAADETADRYVEAGTTEDGKPRYTVRYTARELTGKLPAGVTAVEASFDFTVNVVDNGDGTLAATANYPKGGLAFTNTYSWQPVVVDPDAIKDAAVTKVLKGNRGTDLADGEFEFRMTTRATAGSLDTVKDADGKVWPATKTAANKADGSVDFGEMSFSAAGAYEVTIKEVKGDAAHMTYDAHEFTYTIEVTYDPATGKLSAKVEGLDPAKATFTNVYFDAKDAKDVVVGGADEPQASVDGKLVGVGDELTYTIDWVNNAVDENGVPVEADIVVVDKIPHGTEFVSASKGGKHENGAVTWKFDNQPAGASGTVTLTVRVTDDAVVTGSVENQASIQIGGNKVTTNATETFVPGKSETTHPDSVKPGETVLTYQIKFHNADGADATATVVDQLGKGLEYQAGSARVNGVRVEPEVEGSTAVGTTLTWNLTDLAADRDVIITFDVKVAENGPNTVDNQAVVNGHVSNVETTPFPTKDAKHVYNKDDVLVDGKLVGVGETLTFKIDWWHDATLDNGNPTVTVVDKLPDGMKPKEGTISDNGKYDAKKGTITWTIEDAAGKHGTVSFQAEVTDAVIEAAKRGEVTNIAKVNDHASQSVSVSVPTKTVAKPEGQGGSIKVGDEVVYTINYKNTEATAATVTIIDKLPAGITYKADSATPAASYDEAKRTLTWTLADVASGESGSVSFTGVVNESAIEGGVDNKAGIQLGENGPVISTNTESTKMATGDLTISKHVKSAIADVTAPTAEFTFDVTLTDAAGKQLAGTYNYEGDKKGVIENGAGQIKLAHGQSITIKGLPEGAKYKVVETEVDGFTAIADTMNGTIAKNQTAQAAFTNTYTPAPIVIPGGTGSALQVKKVLDGRDWLPNESYSFELKAVTEGAPMPGGAGNVATATDDKTVSFGDISFAKPGAYEYRIVETGTSADANLTFSKAEYKLVVTVEANGSVLQATSVLTQVKDDAGKTVDKVLKVPGEVMTFINTYKKPTQGKDVTAAGNPGTSIDGQLVQVGSKLVYTIAWVNDAVDETGKAVAANVTITDQIPTGTAYVKDSATNGGVYNADTNTLSWNLGEQKANASGTVSFTVEVTEAALNNKVENQANIQIGDNNVETTSKPEVFVPGKTSADDNKGDIQVGDVLTYTVSYANPGKDSATVTITDVLPSGLTYVDKSASDGGIYNNRANTLTWTIEGVKPGTTGVVTFRATVNEDAVQQGIGNKAAVQIGDNKVETNTTDPDTKPSVGTLTISKTVEAANDPNAPVDTEKAFDFKVNLKDKADNTLTGNYAYTIGEEKGTLSSGTTFKLKHNQSIVIDGLPVGATYEVREKPTDGYTATAEGDTGAITKENPNAAATFTNTYSAALPQGSQVTTANLFSKVLAGRDWKADDSFTFTIAPLNGAPAPEHLEATLTGLTTAADRPVKFGFGVINFTFDHIKDAPVVNGVRTKTFVYKVSENPCNISGVNYDKHVATLKVTLEDKGSGVLSASSVVTRDGQFTNTYTTTPIKPDGEDATAKDGIQIVKTLSGRPIAAGDFEFTMAPDDDATKAKFGDAKVIATNAAELGTGELANTAVATTPVKTGLEFALEDVGETYTFKLTENKGDREGYTYDKAEHTLTFTTADTGNGTLSVTVTLDDKEAAVWTSGAEITPVSIGFANGYSAGSVTVGGNGVVPLTGKKELTGRPMVAHEFEFEVTNAKDANESAAVVATGTNEADGTIKFTGIEYTTEQLNKDVAAGLAEVKRDEAKDLFTYVYNVSEVDKEGDGVDVISGKQVVTVTVSDTHGGELHATVEYLKGGMVFKNAYGTGEGGSKLIALNGTKVLDVKSGNKAPDIAGKYTFELSGSEGAPMPAKTTATNDAAGNISFGEITYTMENVFGAPAAKPEQLVIAEDGADTADAKTAGATDAQAAEADAKADDAVAAEAEAKPAEDESAAKAAFEDEPMVASAQRSKTFTYTVTESGSVAGVSNDPVATKTITVKVTDNGDGTLSVDKQAESAATDFTFTNTYSVKPSESTLTGEGGFTITKTLDGRDLREGEFEFALASQNEGEQTVVTAKNDANGKVAFPAISFNAPGEYHYRLAEVDGGLGGVTYDTTVYDVTATVVDNGDGTLGTTWSVSKGGKALEGKEIVFANGYKAAGTSITFNAAKVLTGRELKKGEFTFELRDANGKVLQTVKNGALTEGGYAPIAFDPITYDEPGTYDYRIVEVKGDAEGITYDETVFTYHVVVTDDGNGQLQVEWTVGETGAPVFQNVYVKPEDPKPADPAKPADPGNGGSGDKLIQTGDNALVGMFAAAFAGMAAIGAGFTARRKKR